MPARDRKHRPSAVQAPGVLRNDLLVGERDGILPAEAEPVAPSAFDPAAIAAEQDAAVDETQAPDLDAVKAILAKDRGDLPAPPTTVYDPGPSVRGGPDANDPGFVRTFQDTTNDHGFSKTGPDTTNDHGFSRGPPAAGWSVPAVLRGKPSAPTHAIANDPGSAGLPEEAKRALVAKHFPEDAAPPQPGEASFRGPLPQPPPREEQEAEIERFKQSLVEKHFGKQRPVDFDDRMAKARAREDRETFAARLGLAADGITGAVTGKNETAFNAGMLKDAGKFPARVQQDIDNARQEDEFAVRLATSRNGKAALDPASVEAEWNALSAQYPEVAGNIGRENFLAMSAESRGKWLSQSGTQTRSDNSIEEGRRKFDETQKMKAQLRTDAIAKFRTGLQAVQSRFGSTQAKDLGTRAAKYAEIQSTFEGIDRLAPGLIFGKVPPGYAYDGVEKLKADVLGGKFGAPGRFTETETATIRNHISQMKDLVARLRTGAAITEDEQRQYNDLFGQVAFAPPPVQAAALDMFRNSIGAKFKADVAGYMTDPNLRQVFDTYSQAGGASPLADVWTRGSESALPETSGGFDDILGEFDQGVGAAPTSPAPSAPPSRPAPAARRITVSNGSETLKIDPADLAEAEAEGFSVVGGGGN